MTSGNDIGTMCANMNIINNSNAKTTNVLDNFNFCKDYTNIETDAFITAAALEHFGLESMDVKEYSFVPAEIIHGTKCERRVWLHQQMKEMLTKFVMSGQESQHQHIRDQVI
jgi:hypothetical protein